MHTLHSLSFYYKILTIPRPQGSIRKLIMLTLLLPRLIKQCVEAFRRAQILSAESGSSAYGGSLLSQNAFLSGVRVVVLVLIPVRTAVLRRSSYTYSYRYMYIYCTGRVASSSVVASTTSSSQLP